MWWIGVVLTAWAGPADEAFDALVEGREGRALQILRGALDDDPDGAHRCLLGEVALQVGRNAEALSVLEDVPDDALCAGRASFVQAEALRRSGDPAGAADRYEALTDALLAPTTQPLAERLERWAQRLLEEDPPNTTTAAALLSTAARLEPAGSEARLTLVRRLADLEPTTGPDTFAVAELSAVIAGSEGLAAADRRRLALLSSPQAALALLAPLPDDAATMWTRGAAVHSGALAKRYTFAKALIEAHPTSDEAQRTRRELGQVLANAGWTTEARALLEPLTDTSGDVGREATWALVRLAVRAGDADALAQVDRVLERYPAAPFRNEAETMREELELDDLRAEAHNGRFDATAWDRVAVRADLALEAAWATNDLDDRVRRLDALAARWPKSIEAREALRHRALTHPDGLEWLRTRDHGLANEVLEELSEPEIGIRTPPLDGEASVELLVRGLEEVELRLHRIDVEGWLRADGSPGSLGDLDVAIVAPDRSWTVTVPDGGVEVRFTTPVAVPGPGLYAVTAATSDREARTLLMVSDARIVARSQGPDLAMVALRDGSPSAGARFWVRAGEQITEVRPDRDGLAKTTVSSAPIVVVAETPGGPAILEVGYGFAEEDNPVQTTLDLDRPVYRPGDEVRFRALGTRAGVPLQGEWRISLVGASGQVYQELRTKADRAGTVTGELIIPWNSTGRRSHGAAREDLTLQARPPGQDTEVRLANIPVIDAVPGTRQLDVEPDEEVVRVVVRDGQGVPVPDQAVRLFIDNDAPVIRRTSPAGEVVVDAPPAGLPWTVAAVLPQEEGGRRSWSRPAPTAMQMELRLDDPRARPGEPVRLDMTGEGKALLQVVRIHATPTRPEAHKAPERFAVPELTVFERGTDDAGTWDVRETLSTRLVSLAEGSTTLPGLEEGRYRIELSQPDGRASTRAVTLDVRPGTRIRLAEAPLVGQTVSVGVDGGWALLTAEGSRMLAARLVPPGRERSMDVDPRWHGEVQLVATALDDQHQRTVEVDASLRVELEAVRRGDRWSVAGRVTNAAGNPQRAQVVVRAVDQLLLDELGLPPTLSEGLLARRQAWASETARARALRHGGWAIPLAAELMAEAAREADARRKKLASEGRLSESKVADVLDADVPLGVMGSAIGGTGYGSGGGAFGSRGSGGVGVVGGDPVILGSKGYTLYGTRSVGLWRVISTDRDGRFAVDTDAPDPRRTWRVHAVAVSAGIVGMAEEWVGPATEPWVAIAPLRPGWPGDIARPMAQIVNPSSAAVTVGVRVDDLDSEHALEPGASVAVPMGDLAAGEYRDVELRVAGQVVGSARATFALAEGAPGSGEMTVAVSGVEGGTIAGAVALLDDPWIVERPAHAIGAARAALAAWPVLTLSERDDALRRIRAGVAVARDRVGSLDARDGAQALRLVAEAASMLELPRHMVEATAANLLVEPATPQERVEVAYARAVAEVSVQEATLGRLQRDAEHLDDDGRGLLARLLDRLDTKAATELATASAVQWDLHAHERRRRLDPGVVLQRSPPPLGDPARADWVRTVALALGSTPGTSAHEGLRRTLDATDAPLSWREAVPAGTSSDDAHRWPAGPSGRPAEVASAASGRPGEEDLRCGQAGRPCRVAVGDTVAAQHTFEATGGLQATSRGRFLEATTLGSYTLWRSTTDGDQAIHVEVVDAEPMTPLGQGELLAVAKQRRGVGEPFADVLADRDSLEDWRPELRGQAADLRFDAANPEEPTAWIAAFEDLRDEVPGSTIFPDDVVHTARAYQRLGRNERAIRVYERAIGQVFLEEAAVVANVGNLVGPLAGLQALREVTLRYPAVPVVRQSEFALPDRLLELVGNIPEKARERGVTDTELQLMAADWDRRFVALAGDSPLAPEAGLRLATGLTDLGARERALGWVQRLRRAHSDHVLTDRWMLLEALLLTELGRGDRADGVLERLSEEDVPLGGGRLGPSELRDDARLALARVAEAEQRWDDAAERYEQVRSTFPEASLAAAALTEVGLRLDDTLVVGRLAERSRLRIQATNLDDVQVRAYAIDLRTVFLRDGGLPDPAAVRIDGLRPSWTGTRPVHAGPFPEARWLDLPLQGPGAWLVRLDTDGASAVAWVLRTDLEVHYSDQGDMRRLSVRLKNAPVPEASIRAMGAYGIVAETTDARGVAMVGRGSGALVQVGPHVALTADVRPGGSSVAIGAPRPSQPSLMDRVKGREKQRRQKRRGQYDYIGTEAAPAIEASEL